MYTKYHNAIPESKDKALRTRVHNTYGKWCSLTLVARTLVHRQSRKKKKSRCLVLHLSAWKEKTSWGNCDNRVGNSASNGGGFAIATPLLKSRDGRTTLEVFHVPSTV